jgi:hypothetical protein
MRHIRRGRTKLLASHKPSSCHRSSSQKPLNAKMEIMQQQHRTSKTATTIMMIVVVLFFFFSPSPDGALGAWGGGADGAGVTASVPPLLAATGPGPGASSCGGAVGSSGSLDSANGLGISGVSGSGGVEGVTTAVSLGSSSGTGGGVTTV